MAKNETQIISEPSAVELCDMNPTQPVGEFVFRYYVTLSSAPQDAWRFYTVGARYTHVDGCGPEESRDPGPAVGQYLIHVNITHQRFTECHFLIRSIIEQAAADGRVHLLVTGDTSRNRGPADTFVQSFVLEYVAIVNQYFVTNSILKVYTSQPQMQLMSSPPPPPPPPPPQPQLQSQTSG